MASTTTVYLMALTIAIFIGAASSQTTVTGYTNHTVGGDAGWFFNVATNKSAADYSAWAANQTFSLGDYLIFNTNTNQTVIETYNQTTYRNCSIDESEDDDTFQYNGGNNQFGESTVITVPLTLEGPSYYFSSASDGIQCLNGMRFNITVQRGLGLPSSLSQPPPPPYAEPPSSEEDTNQPGASDGFRIGANLRGVLAVTLLGVPLFIV